MIKFAFPRSGPASARTLSLIAAVLLAGGCVEPQLGVSFRQNGSALRPVTETGQLPQLGSSLRLSPNDKVRVRVLPIDSATSSPVFESDDVVAYHFNLTSEEYHVMRGDELAVHFGADPKLDTHVIVRPDGRITLANVAELVASGKTPAELSTEINQAYRERLNQPAVSVTVSRSNLSIAELSGDSVVQGDGTISVLKIGQFKAAGQTPDQLSEAMTEAASKLWGNTLKAEVTRSRPVPTALTENRHLVGYDSVVSIAPDGRLLLPEIGYIEATDKTVAALQREVEERIKSRYKNPLAVQIALETSESRVVYVNGEVVRPGAYPVANSLTLLKVLSLAGGVMETGSLNEVILIHRNETNDVFVYVTNLKEFIEKGIAGNDLALSPQDIVMVPKTSVAKANQWIEQYITRMLPFSRSVSYSYFQGDTSSTSR